MLYRVSLGQEALYRVRQGSVVFLHFPLLGSSEHRMVNGDCILKIAKIGGRGSESISHCNDNVWFSSTVLDGKKC